MSERERDSSKMVRGRTYPESLAVSHLNLEEGEVSEDLHVLVVPLQSIAIALDGLFVLLVRSLQ